MGLFGGGNRVPQFFGGNSGMASHAMPALPRMEQQPQVMPQMQQQQMQPQMQAPNGNTGIVPPQQGVQPTGVMGIQGGPQFNPQQLNPHQMNHQQFQPQGYAQQQPGYFQRFMQNPQFQQFAQHSPWGHMFQQRFGGQ